MKTPNLLTVPKAGLTKREKLTAFKKLHKIQTHRASQMRREEHPWSALLMSPALQLASDYGSDAATMPELVAEFCRLLDEQRLLVNGPTEREAVRELCRLNGIVCEL